VPVRYVGWRYRLDRVVSLALADRMDDLVVRGRSGPLDSTDVTAAFADYLLGAASAERDLRPPRYLVGHGRRG